MLFLFILSRRFFPWLGVGSCFAPIFERLKLDVGYWKLQIQEFGRLFSHMAGRPWDVYEMRSLISKRQFYLKRFKPEPAETA